MELMENVYSTVSFNGKTNEPQLVSATTISNWVSSFLVFRWNPRQPGFDAMPPLPPATNR